MPRARACPNPARPLRSCCRKSPWSPYEFSFDVIQYLGREPVRLNRPPGNSYCSPGKSTFSERGLCASKRSCGSQIIFGALVESSDADRKRVVKGKSVSERVDLGGLGIMKENKYNITYVKTQKNK